MHNEEWSGTRVASALARLGDAGYPQARLARMAGVNRSQVNRWTRGENRPGYDAVRRLAIGVWHRHPELARELVEASGYPWTEPSEADRSPPGLIDERLGREDAELVRKALQDVYPDEAADILQRIEATLRRRGAG